MSAEVISLLKMLQNLSSLSIHMKERKNQIIQVGKTYKLFNLILFANSYEKAVKVFYWNYLTNNNKINADRMI